MLGLGYILDGFFLIVFIVCVYNKFCCWKFVCVVFILSSGDKFEDIWVFFDEFFDGVYLV